MPPRTIDNLGVDISTRYAEDQKNLDVNILKGSKNVPQAEIESLSSSFQSEVELLFGLEKRNTTWATFFAPPKYSEQKKRLFSHHIIPALGTEAQKEAQIAKVSSIVSEDEEIEKKLYEKSEEEEKEGKSKQQRAWEKQREKEAEEKEKKIILSLLNSISDLDKFLAAINSRRTQYQRG